MAVVSVRVDDEMLEILRAHQVNVSELARTAFQAEVRRIRARETLERLGRLNLPTRGTPSEQVLRRARDERHARP